jgi:hypothetical protein
LIQDRAARGFRARGGGGAVAGALLRGGWSPAQTESGVPGLDSGRGVALEHRSGMGSALGCLGMRCKAGGMPTDGEAALGVAACRRRAPFWPRNGFAASNSSAKQTGRCRGPHRGFKPAGRGVAAPETMASGGGRRCARDQDVAGLLRAPGLRGSARGAPARARRRSAGSERQRR